MLKKTIIVLTVLLLAGVTLYGQLRIGNNRKTTKPTQQDEHVLIPAGSPIMEMEANLMNELANFDLLREKLLSLNLTAEQEPQIEALLEQYNEIVEEFYPQFIAAREKIEQAILAEESERITSLASDLPDFTKFKLQIDEALASIIKVLTSEQQKLFNKN